MSSTADVILIGGGIHGASLAFHLARRGLKILLLEKSTLASGATGRSSGLVRMHYDLEPESRLAWVSFQYFRDWKEMVGGECGFTRTGFLYIPQALAAKKPVILLVAHFVAIEVAGMALAPDYFMIDMYKRPKNRFFDWMIRTRRTRFVPRHGGLLVERREGIKPVIRGLKKGGTFFYLSDQDQGREGAVFVPFFGVPAATLTALTRLTQLTEAVVIPCFARQRPWGRGYELIFQPPLENFPGMDVVADTARMNRVIEDAVRTMPEQYFWSHRRFKTRPEGGPAFY